MRVAISTRGIPTEMCTGRKAALASSFCENMRNVRALQSATGVQARHTQYWQHITGVFLSCRKKVLEFLNH
jgi:hypothetical protein